ncbi:MAG: hypothetical protein V1754_07005 [Pseudomonadota bacterium]
MIVRKCFLRIEFLLVVAGVLGAVPAQLHAQVEEAAVARIELLNRKAIEEYDSMEFEAAKKLLLEAISVAKDAEVVRHKILGTTYVNLGVILGGGFNDQANAIKCFRAALTIDRSAKLDPGRATPALEEMFKTAVDSMPPVPQLSQASFLHKPVDEAEKGQRIEIEATVANELGAARVVLFFRRSGVSAYEELELSQDVRVNELHGSNRSTEQGEIYKGVIPGEKVRGKFMHYYLVAQDVNGRRLAGQGSVRQPIVIMIHGEAETYEDTKPNEPEEKEEPSKPTVSIGILAGTGLGLVAGGKSEHIHPYGSAGLTDTVGINTGVALAPFHVIGDLSFHLDEYWQLGGFARVQLVNALWGGAVQSKISVLGVARAKRFFWEGRTRFFLSFGAGGGQLRHRVSLGDYDNDPITDNGVIDARVAGVFLLELGGGLTVMLDDMIGFVVEANTMYFIPNFAAHLDVNVGFVLCL